MSNDLLASLGLEFVDPYSISKGLKKLKPTEEPQIFSVISKLPGMERTIITFNQHDFYNQIKRKIRCSGGACCAKAAELNEFLKSLPENDERKRQNCRRQKRYIIPVVVYQGKSAQAYGGPIEIRYLDLSDSTYRDWDQARSTVNEDIAPFYERDFVMTQGAQIKMVPKITHLENRAKWLTDPAINAEVMAAVSAPDFIENFVKTVPVLLQEDEFLEAWESAKKTQTAAESAIAQAAVQPMVQPAIQPAVRPMIQTTVQPAVQTAPQPAQVVQPAIQPAVQPMVQAPSMPVQPQVAFTPQNVINGSFSAGTLTNTVTPEAAINMGATPIDMTSMQPQIAQPASVENTAIPVQPAPAPVQSSPAPSTVEISLDGIGDLQSIIDNLPQ